MPSPLAEVHRQLHRLRRRRALVRRGMACATALVILTGVLAAAFALDFLVDLRPAPRAAALIALAFAGGWVACQAVGRWLGVRESETDIALLVEQNHAFGGDLVAALQFQSPEARDWGSLQLERAVVAEVEESSRDVDLLDSFRWKPLPGRVALAALVIVAAAGLGVVFPRHAAVFFSRLMLADVPYPTRTIVVSMSVNDIPVDFTDLRPLRVPAGAPLSFAVQTEGEQPESGAVLLQAGSSGRTEIVLTREQGSEKEESPQTKGLYVGALPAIQEPLTFHVRVGDARTAARRIELVPLPVVALDLVPTPPDYARWNAPAPPPAGVRTAFVLPGSDIELVVRGINKPLREVTVRFEREGERVVAPLSPDRAGTTWRLPPVGTPLAEIVEPIAFTIDAIDADGLSPPEPLIGSIRLRADRPPRVAADAVVRRVLPTAKPELSYSATDDFGIRAVRAHVRVMRADGQSDDQTIDLPIDGEATSEVRGRAALDLSNYALEKGDRVVVTVEAEDERGAREGEMALSEPIAFEVTDRDGLLAALLETDEESADRLDAIIRRELGIGDAR